MSNNPKDHNIVWPSQTEETPSQKGASVSPPRKPPYDEKITIAQPLLGHERFTARASKRRSYTSPKIKSATKK